MPLKRFKVEKLIEEANEVKYAGDVQELTEELADGCKSFTLSLKLQESLLSRLKKNV